MATGKARIGLLVGVLALCGVGATVAWWLLPTQHRRVRSYLLLRRDKEEEAALSWFEKLSLVSPPAGCSPELALVRMRDEAIEPLIALLDDPDPQLRGDAFRDLGYLGDARAVAALLPVLEEGSYEDRVHAARALGVIGDPRAAEPLMAAMNSKRSPVREAAARALASLGDRRAGEALIPGLTDRAEEVRKAAARACGELRVQQAAAPLRALLQDAHVRQTAVWALGGIKDPAAVPLLAEWVDQGDWLFCREVALALGRIGDEHAVWLLQRSYSMPRNRYGKLRAAAGLAITGRNDAFEYLIASLKDTEAYIAGRAVGLLGEVGDPRAVPTLIAMHQHNVNAGAAESLGKIGDPRAVEPLIRSLPGPGILCEKYHTIDALGRLGDPRAIAPLEAALETETWADNNCVEILVALRSIRRSSGRPAPEE